VNEKTFRDGLFELRVCDVYNVFLRMKERGFLKQVLGID